MTRLEETKTVKDALRHVGINAVVGHGRGTGWGWLHINIGSSDQFGIPHDIDPITLNHYDCLPCQTIHEISRLALMVTWQVTGRHGEYDGHINIYTQKHWNQQTKESVEICQPIEPLRLLNVA